MNKRALLLAFFLIIESCTHSSSNGGVQEPMQGKAGSKNRSHGRQLDDPDELLGPDKCQLFKNTTQAPPFFVPLNGGGLMVTRLLKPCVNRDGLRGFEENTPWMAMGFPCTGGGGHAEWKDQYAQPKMASFKITTECAMQPSSVEVVKSEGANVLGLPVESELLAYNPLAIQYWELDEYKDADVGEDVFLRNQEALSIGWQKFQKAEPIPVRLYGRENAWVQGNHFYVVNAIIHKVEFNSFRLEIIDAKALSESEISDLDKRCRALRPKRRCSDVF